MIGKTILHYKIIEKLGEGGMGVVYLAEDTKLERQVAIKFLPSHIAADSDERKRFEIEAKAAAALNHPNIATIYAIEEADNPLTTNKESFLVMEFISGKHLKDYVKTYLDTSQLMPQQEAIDIAIQIAKGLQAAHKKGIVHRDIKSANIMSNLDNQIKIMDFGLAKFRGSAQLTQIGTTVGTAAYMSPEQARGEDADKRSDIWSFGVVFYEMLTGKLPFKGEYEQAVLYAMLNEEPQSINELKPDISPEVVSIVSKCLEKDIEKRYQDFSEILNDFEEIKTGTSKTVDVQLNSSKSEKKTRHIYIALFIMAVVVVVLFFLPDDAKIPLDNANQNEIEKLAILPFSNLKPDADTDYLGYALADQVIGAMSYVKHILVRPSSTIRKYVGQTVDIENVKDELKVEYLLTGNYLKQGNIVRLNIELINAESGNLIWRDVIEEKYENSFKLQDIISGKIISGLEIQFSPAEKEMTSADVPSNALAYEYYLRAVAYKDNSAENLLAIDMLNKAVALDSLYAPAWSQLGWRYHHLALYGLGTSELYSNAIQYYKKAIMLKPNYVRPMTALATLYTEIDKKDEALQISRKILSINPNNPDVHFLLGYIYRYVGMIDEAKKSFDIAIKINPDPAYRSAGHVYLSMDENEKAIEYYALDKENPFYYSNAGYAYFKMDDYNNAIPLFDKAIELDPNSSNEYYAMSCKAFIGGDSEKASAYLQLIENQNIKDGEFWYAIADLYGLYNKPLKTIETLRKTVELGYYNYPAFLNNDYFDTLRDNPEFQEVMGLAKEKHEAFKSKYFPGKQ